MTLRYAVTSAGASPSRPTRSFAWRRILLAIIVFSLIAFKPIVSPASTKAADLPAPPWWNGTQCDTARHPGSYSLGASFRGVVACGPINSFTPVTFGGGVTQYEWQCTELVKRYLYLAFNVKPYSANGSQMVTNLPSGTPLTPVSYNPSAPAHMMPSVGDVISYGKPGLEAGHTAIIMAIGVDGNGNGSLTVLQQNAVHRGVVAPVQTFGIGRWVISPAYDAYNKPLPVNGWLHVPGSSPAPPPVVINPQQVGALGQPSGNLVPGGQASFTVQIKNYGTAPTPALFPYIEGSSPGGPWRTSNPQPSSRIIQPGQTATFQVQVDLCCSGTYTASGIFLWNVSTNTYWEPLPPNGLDPSVTFVVAPPCIADPHSDGALIKLASNSAVYVVYGGGRFQIPDMTTLRAMGLRQDCINTIDSTTMGAIRENWARDGTLLQGFGSAGVYFIVGGAALPIANADAFNRLGLDWGAIHVVPRGPLDVMAALVPQDGTLLKEQSSVTVYVMQNGQKRPFDGPTSFEQWEGVDGWSRIVTVPDGSLAGIPTGPTIYAQATLSVTATTGGTVTVSPNAAAYAVGTVVTLTAVPAAGYTFTGWLIDNTTASPANPYQLTMDTNHTVQATFAAAAPDWSSLGGSLADAPATASFNGRLYVFTRNADGTFSTRSSADATTWTDWTNIGGNVTSSPAAVSFNGRLYLFAKDANNALIVSSSADGATWTAWQSLGGTLTAAPSAASANGVLSVFVRWSDGSLYTTRSTDGVTFGGWQGLGGSMIDPPVAAGFQGQIYVFTVGPAILYGSPVDNTMFMQRSTDGITFSDPVLLGGIFVNTPAATVVKTAGGSEYLYMFADGSDNALYARNTADGDNWTPWYYYGGQLVGQPAAASLNGTVYAFARGADNTLQMISLQP